MNTTPRYAVITAAHNEEAHIEDLIRSVVNQTILPEKFIVVSDGSTDGTETIVARYAAAWKFISLIRIGQPHARNFRAKVLALRAGYAALGKTDVEFVGCLDADITLPADYYERVLAKMAANPRLGVAAGICCEMTRSGWKSTNSNKGHAPGAIQVFRRSCYESIGGYQQVSEVGEDSLAEILARKGGWETRSFGDIPTYHHRPNGSASGNILRTCFRLGLTDYLLGKHPLYVGLKSIRRIPSHPFFLGALWLVAGYCKLWFSRAPMDVSPDVAKFVRAEELRNIRGILFQWRRPFYKYGGSP